MSCREVSCAQQLCVFRSVEGCVPPGAHSLEIWPWIFVGMLAVPGTHFTQKVAFVEPVRAPWWSIYTFREQKAIICNCCQTFACRHASRAAWKNTRRGWTLRGRTRWLKCTSSRRSKLRTMVWLPRHQAWFAEPASLKVLCMLSSLGHAHLKHIPLSPLNALTPTYKYCLGSVELNET